MSKKKNAILIHGYNGIPKIYNYFKEELIKRDYNVIMPEFPPREGVIVTDWFNIIENYKTEFNSNSVVIAHSIGNEFMIKYLSKNNLNINLFIGLAGFVNAFEVEGREDLNRAIKEFQISEDEKNIFNYLVKKKYSIYSDNDHIVPLEILQKFSQEIKAEPIFISGIGHMGSKSGVEKIEQVISIIDKEKKGE